MTEINNKLLALFEGKCWHEWIWDNPMTGVECKLCKAEQIEPSYPDYATSPADRERLLQYLMGQGEMWFDFYYSGLRSAFHGDDAEIANSGGFTASLFLPVDGIPRWLLLLQEWLGLDETKSRFGWQQCDGGQVSYPYCFRTNNCECGGTGGYLAEWAKGE